MDPPPFVSPYIKTKNETVRKRISLTLRKVLPFIIENLKAEGYTFATAKDYTKWRWGKTSDELSEE